MKAKILILIGLFTLAIDGLKTFYISSGFDNKIATSLLQIIFSFFGITMIIIYKKKDHSLNAKNATEEVIKHLNNLNISEN